MKFTGMDALSRWTEGTGPHADIVISSRIRLARNLAALPFPHLLKASQQQEVVENVKKAIEAGREKDKFKNLKLVSLEELSALERQSLMEKHLISPQHAEAEGGKAVILNQDESLSIMVNEEDHLRIQCLLPALQLHECRELADEIDNYLEENLDLAFGEQFGYLASCPTNVGTGLRGSVMVHLPALAITRQAGRVLSALSRVGLVVRGLYGEGSEAYGNLFQISNQVTLGQNEDEIISNLSSVVKQVLDQEYATRKKLLQESRQQLEDRVYRALGVLTQARIISSKEAISLISEVRLGIDLKIIKEIDARVLNRLMVLIQPANLQLRTGKSLEGMERDWERARLIREKITAEEVR